MGLRFRRTISIFPGVRLNLSKSGISLSLRPRVPTIDVVTRVKVVKQLHDKV